MVSLLGSQSVLIISQNDKAKISLSLATANKQMPILIKVEYRVKLLDHDWVIAKKHKLIPSIYTKLGMQSSQMFIRIYSSKHDTSTIYTHSKDVNDLISDEKLYNFTITEDTDGGPNENLRYKKTIQMIIEHFIKYDLDTIIVVCFTPYQSASNSVERQIALLSHDLARIILPYDIFGSHLDEQLKTADEELEKHNFKVAGEILASVYYLVLVEYIDPEEHYQSKLDKNSVAWIERHTMTCHYITQ
ncbi:32016_t:CDS:2, partial [Gigaspora margarita]